MLDPLFPVVSYVLLDELVDFLLRTGREVPSQPALPAEAGPCPPGHPPKPPPPDD